MSEDKCPFCGEPKVRESVCGISYSCGTLGPDINGEYSTGHTCDIHTWTRLLRKQDTELARLRTELATARAECFTLSQQLDVVVDAYECGEWNEGRGMKQLHLPRAWYQDVLEAQGNE
jgi:hypothetical protein